MEKNENELWEEALTTVCMRKGKNQENEADWAKQSQGGRRSFPASCHSPKDQDVIWESFQVPLLKNCLLQYSSNLISLENITLLIFLKVTLCKLPFLPLTKDLQREVWKEVGCQGDNMPLQFSKTFGWARVAVQSEFHTILWLWGLLGWCFVPLSVTPT